MLFPGSLKHNLDVLGREHAVDVRGDRISTGSQYRHYLETLDLMQNCFAEVRKHRKEMGISLKVSQIMTPGGFVTATLADNLAEVVSAMIFRGVNGIVIPAGEGQYTLIERGKALKAYAEGYGTQTIQSLPEELKSIPATATPDEPVSVLVARMSKGGVEHAVVLDEKKFPKGVVSSKDVLSLLLYHARLPGGPPSAA
jgi:CBS domain-containing protein